MNSFYIRTKEDLEEAVETFGFLPFFQNEIKGFSIEENCDPAVYFSKQPGVWEWKGEVIQDLHCAYGKFFRNKAAFISKKWFPDFANYRRDGYDYDARVDEGIAKANEAYLYEIIASRHSILSKEAKAIGGYVKPRTTGPDSWEPRKGFDTAVTRLMMQGYITTTNFEYETDKNGEFYGWGIARYATPEAFFGKRFVNHVYERTPEESYRKIRKHFQRILPEADDTILSRFIG